MTAVDNTALAEPGFQRLLNLLRGLESLALACSGGLASSLPLVAARMALGERVLALTVAMPYRAAEEIAEARVLTTRLGARHRVLELAMPAEITPGCRMTLKSISIGCGG